MRLLLKWAYQTANPGGSVILGELWPGRPGGSHVESHTGPRGLENCSRTCKRMLDVSKMQKVIEVRSSLPAVESSPKRKEQLREPYKQERPPSKENAQASQSIGDFQRRTYS